MVPIIITSKDAWAAHALFNPNAYSPNLKGLVLSCAVRAGILRHHVQEVAAYVEADRAELVHQITSMWDEQFKPVLEADGSADASVHLSSLGYLSALDGVLVSLKSLLDVYATVISSSFVASQNLKFNRGKVDDTGRELSGGRLIKWLRRSVPTEHAKSASVIADIIIQHSGGWLTDAIELRDKIVHGGEIRALKPVATTLRLFSKSGFNSQALSGPYMHDGRDVPTYCGNILTNASAFLEETIKHLPGIEMKLINLGEYGKITR